MALCQECKVPATVGWGNPPEWLCMEHFDERLAQTVGVLFTRPIQFLDPIFVAHRNQVARGPRAGGVST